MKKFKYAYISSVSPITITTSLEIMFYFERLRRPFRKKIYICYLLLSKSFVLNYLVLQN